MSEEAGRRETRRSVQSFPISAEEYWTRREQDDRWRDTFDARLDRLERMLATMVTLAKWVLGVTATAALSSVIDLIIHGGRL